MVVPSYFGTPSRYPSSLQSSRPPISVTPSCTAPRFTFKEPMVLTATGTGFQGGGGLEQFVQPPWLFLKWHFPLMTENCTPAGVRLPMARAFPFLFLFSRDTDESDTEVVVLSVLDELSSEEEELLSLLRSTRRFPFFSRFSFFFLRSFSLRAFFLAFLRFSFSASLRLRFQETGRCFKPIHVQINDPSTYRSANASPNRPRCVPWYSSNLAIALTHFGAPTRLRSTFNFLKSGEYVSSKPRDSRSKSGASSCIGVSLLVVWGSTAGVRPDAMSLYFFRRSLTGCMCSAVAETPH